MARKVTPITQRRDRLVEAAIRSALYAEGYARSGPGDDIDAWRKSARKVGRELGRPIRTYSWAGGAEAHLTDWPANPDEERVHAAQMRESANKMSEVFRQSRASSRVRPPD